jgi:hypothetical protein
MFLCPVVVDELRMTMPIVVAGEVREMFGTLQDQDAHNWVMDVIEVL